MQFWIAPFLAAILVSIARGFVAPTRARRCTVSQSHIFRTAANSPFQLNGEQWEPPKKKKSPKQAKKDKLAKQRAGSDSGGATVNLGKSVEVQVVRVEMVTRGNKAVTIVRGLEVDFEERKRLLKKLKGKCGGGGTVDKTSGVIEVQGSHGTLVLAELKKEGFLLAKQSGKK